MLPDVQLSYLLRPKKKKKTNCVSFTSQDANKQKNIQLFSMNKKATHLATFWPFVTFGLIWEYLMRSVDLLYQKMQLLTDIFIYRPKLKVFRAIFKKQVAISSKPKLSLWDTWLHLESSLTFDKKLYIKHETKYKISYQLKKNGGVMKKSILCDSW